MEVSKTDSSRIYWLNLTISIGGQSIMSDLVKALLHSKESVPGKDLEKEADTDAKWLLHHEKL